MEFKDVTFTYPHASVAVLDHFSYKFDAGKKYVIVGTNGAGKTTLIKLITGLYDNYTGEILLNGKSVRDYSKDELNNIFSVVYQDYSKYQLPIGQAIALRDDYDPARMKEYVNQFGIQEIIERLPNGMESWIGKIDKDGVDISGGEWQRIAIARAFYHSTPVKILDEPTASLDPMAEYEFYRMLNSIGKDITSIFITHRFGAARLADEVVVIKDGVVIENGNHNSLLLQHGAYFEMFEQQRSWYE